jgi:hypothetical protein
LEFLRDIQNLELCAERGHPKVLQDVVRLTVVYILDVALNRAEAKALSKQVKKVLGYFDWERKRQNRFRQATTDMFTILEYWDLLPEDEREDFCTGKTPFSSLAKLIETLWPEAVGPTAEAA